MNIHKAIQENKLAYVAVVTDKGFSLGVAIEGESGYYPATYHSVDSYEKASKWAERCNGGIGVSKDRAVEIQIASMRQPATA